MIGTFLGLGFMLICNTGNAEVPEPITEIDHIPEMPMPIQHDRTANHRWAEKPVLQSRLLDDMEDSANWSHRGHGQMSFTRERFKNGTQSLRLTSPTTSGKVSVTGRPFGSAIIKRSFSGEDWSDYNRLSFWVYPSLPGFRVISLLIQLHNEGSVKVPDEYRREGLNHIILEPDQWNHIVWEIPHLMRDKVTGVELIYRMQGNEPEATDTVCFDFDQLELQKVQADHYEGWDVAPGKIAFSHTGYQLGASKTAIAQGLSDDKFALVDVETYHAVLEKQIRAVETHLGEFQVLDFSEVKEPGTYILRVGPMETGPFRIHENIWRDTIWKTINSFYCQRCGTEIPGIHGACHRDWQGVHGDKRIIINGGWHDAGDLSQGLVNTSETVYAMLSLADRLQDDDALSQRLIEEARWGLDWVLKTRFGDGYRITWATMDFWTDGIIGTPDDVTSEAKNSPFENLLAAAAEALASRVLKSYDPILASYCLRMAQEDWNFAIEKIHQPGVELASAGVLASLELFKATDEQAYAEKAFELAGVIFDSQQRSFMEWEIPLTGFFYTDPGKERILHYLHRGHEQAPIVAMAELCDAFPDHPQWMKWYSVVALHSEYLKTISRFTEPYGMLPSSVYQPDESDRPNFREQVLNGIKLNEDHYLRLFPVWFDFRGNHGTVLSQTKALSTAAHLRGDWELADLCQRQLEWVVGRNPFVESTMYGEGYGYAPQYTAMSGDMVGTLPVGIQTRANYDVPYWPAANCYNYKEVWVHPSSRWLWLMCDLAGPAEVSGYVKADTIQPVEFREVRTGHTTMVNIFEHDGKFHARLPEGQYKVRHEDQEKSVVLLPGKTYHLDLRNPLDFVVSQDTSDDGHVTIKLEAKGAGIAQFTIRTHNLEVRETEKQVNLEAGIPQIISWTGNVINLREPWIAVLIPNGNLAERKEIPM